MDVIEQQHIPSPLIIGDQWTWVIPGGEYSRSDGWVAKYVLVGPDNFVITTSAQGSDHKVTFSSASVVAGTYRWMLQMTKTTVRHTIDRGEVLVEADFADLDDGHDLRTDNEKILDAITALLKGESGKAYSNLSVDGRYLVKRNPLELHELKERYTTIVRQEFEARERRAGRRVGGNVYLRMGV